MCDCQLRRSLRRRELAGDIQANGFLGAPHIHAAAAKDWRAPALSGEHLGPGDFGGAPRRGFDEPHLARVAQCEEMAIDPRDVAGAETSLFPNHLACGGFDAFERTVA